MPKTKTFYIEKRIPSEISTLNAKNDRSAVEEIDEAVVVEVGPHHRLRRRQHASGEGNEAPEAPPFHGAPYVIAPTDEFLQDQHAAKLFLLLFLRLVPNADFREAIPQRIAREPQHTGGLALVPMSTPQGFADHLVLPLL